MVTGLTLCADISFSRCPLAGFGCRLVKFLRVIPEREKASGNIIFPLQDRRRSVDSISQYTGSE